MKLWLLTREGDADWDTYDSAVVAAETAEDAVLIHPDGEHRNWPPRDRRLSNATWAKTLTEVTAKLIGDAAPDIDRGVVLASFNAG